MSALVLTAASALGPALVRTAGQAALQFANQAITQAFDNRSFDGPRLESFHVQTSRDGAPMPRHYGRSRMAGQVIWASKLTEIATEEDAGGKGGGPTIRNFSYSISFAIALCEGVILSVDRLWANGSALDMRGLNFRVYKGTQDQLPDPIISTIDGPDVPAFRGTAYIVFEDFPLDDFGARLPQINAEVIRIPEQADQAMQMENLITGVNLLPSSGEFAYSPDVIEERLSPGSARAVNVNNISGQADIKRALDQLSDQLPHCKSVSIIISWFGSDLRCGMCQIRPGVELSNRQIEGADWSVGGVKRGDAYQVSHDDKGRPIFGGTPSDRSILRAITELKSRGFQVTLYPFILMDISEDDNLPDPYGREHQPDFPWRGRITSAIAPFDHQGQAQHGTSEGSLQILPQIESFFGACQPSDFGIENGLPQYNGPDENSFRRFILHYAKLAALAGGVDRFVIGSEMRGLTTLRSSSNSYPAVGQLQTLAQDVRHILGAGPQLTYAADWSEYFGHHPQDGSGDVNFHLDDLWASDAIDAVGIDAYFPLSDWRAGTSHIDAAQAHSIYDTAYLSSQMEGGEGYDWYYRSIDDRATQTRTEITDGAYGKPWVYRYKDVRNWWLNPHFNRIGGQEESQPTAWLPQSKPIWFTEIGCPAIDKGANQPNVFVDPKSSESRHPYFSAGTRDDLIQRRYIESFISYWQSAQGHNPVSTIYNAPMVDLNSLHVWCWDARPFPAFPSLDTVWSDGQNWHLGHWISGRSGLIPLADIVRDLAFKSGAQSVDTSRVTGIVQGYLIDRPMTTRAALQPLASVYGFNLIERAQALSFVSIGAEARLDIGFDDIVGPSSASLQYIKEDSASRLRDVRLHFIDGTRDYQLGSVSARDLSAETVRVLDINVPIVLEHGFAKGVADRVLQDALSADRALSFNIRASDFRLEVGDLIRVEGDDTLWQVSSLDGLQTVGVDARRVERGSAFTPPVSGGLPGQPLLRPWISQPDIIVLDMPLLAGDTSRDGPVIAAQAVPFRAIHIAPEPDSATEYNTLTLRRPAHIGVLQSVFRRGPTRYFDRTNVFDVQFSSGQFSSITPAALLSGGNLFALETGLGWEVLQAQDVILIAPQTYRFKTFLRGLMGSETEMVDCVELGARLVSLTRDMQALALPSDVLNQSLAFVANVNGREPLPFNFTYTGVNLRPLSPVHGKVELTPHSALLSWVRRTRIGGDNWAAVEIPLGEAREFYQIQVIKDDEVLTSFETDQPSLTLTGPEHDMLRHADHVSIRQGSDLYGFGAALRMAL